MLFPLPYKHEQTCKFVKPSIVPLNPNIDQLYLSFFSFPAQSYLHKQISTLRNMFLLCDSSRFFIKTHNYAYIILIREVAKSIFFSGPTTFALTPPLLAAEPLKKN